MTLIGVGYRHEIRERILAAMPPVEALEVMVDHYVSGVRGQREALLSLAERVPVYLHGVGLSLGSVEPLPMDYLDAVAAFARDVGAGWYSEHLAFTRAGGLDLAQLLPVPRTAAALDLVCEKVDRVQERVGLPMLLENIATYFRWPDDEMDEVDFLMEVCGRTGASLLVDVENLRINAIHHGIDDRSWIERLPAGLVRAVHVAGGREQEGVAIDTHDQPVSEHTLRLLEALLVSQRPDVVILERDQELHSFEEAVADVETIRALRDRAAGASRPAAGSAPVSLSSAGTAG